MSRSALFVLALFLVTAPLNAQESFLERDANSDGRLTPKESRLTDIQFRELDESANGELSLGEFNVLWRDLAPPTEANLSYGTQSERQKLDLYLPEKLGEEVPLVLWIHGGSWKRGSKDANPFSTLNDHGFAVASINYRYSTESHFPAQLDDCELAIEWLKSELARRGSKVNSVSAIGLSAGGHLSMLLSAKGAVDRAVSFGAPVDLSQALAVEHYRPTLEDFVGTPLESKIDLLKLASPVHQVSPKSGEFLLFHGTGDRRVPPTEATKLAFVLAKVGVAVELRIVPDGSHSLVGGPRGWRQMLNFLQR